MILFLHFLHVHLLLIYLSPVRSLPKDFLIISIQLMSMQIKNFQNCIYQLWQITAAKIRQKVQSNSVVVVYHYVIKSAFTARHKEKPILVFQNGYFATVFQSVGCSRSFPWISRLCWTILMMKCPALCVCVHSPIQSSCLVYTVSVFNA